MAAWKSRRKYRTTKGTGHVEILGAGAVVHVNGQRHQIDRAFADTIKEAEGRFAAPGRPELFPGQETATFAVTLPVDLWNRLPRPFSTAIADVIQSNVPAVSFPHIVTTTAEGE